MYRHAWKNRCLRNIQDPATNATVKMPAKILINLRKQFWDGRRGQCQVSPEVSKPLLHQVIGTQWRKIDVHWSFAHVVISGQGWRQIKKGVALIIEHAIRSTSVSPRLPNWIQDFQIESKTSKLNPRLPNWITINLNRKPRVAIYPHMLVQYVQGDPPEEVFFFCLWEVKNVDITPMNG